MMMFQFSMFDDKYKFTYIFSSCLQFDLICPCFSYFDSILIYCVKQNSLQMWIESPSRTGEVTEAQIESSKSFPTSAVEL